MIDNKYGLDEEVWFIDIDNNSINRGRIIKIIVEKTIKYDIYSNSVDWNYKRDVDERLIHKSANECKEYIVKNIDTFYYVVGE